MIKFLLIIYILSFINSCFIMAYWQNKYPNIKDMCFISDSNFCLIMFIMGPFSIVVTIFVSIFGRDKMYSYGVQIPFTRIKFA